MIVKRTAVCLLSFAFLSSAHASIESEMNSWFNDMGGYSNYTPAQAVSGQTQTVYTGGRFFMRTPARNYQLLSAQAPSVVGGCGGIDLFAGSFSFINSEQLAALLRNAANNAIGMGFMAAVKTMSPWLADVLQWLQDQAGKVNNMNLNSCQLAEGTVSAIGSMLTDKKEQASAQGTGSTLSNLWADSFQSFDKWKEGKDAKKQAREHAKAADNGLKEMLEGGNLVWKALQKTSVPNDLKLLMMSMLGTIIITPAGDAGSGSADNSSGTQAKWTYKAGSGVGFKDFIGTVENRYVRGVNLLTCDENVECKNVGNPQIDPWADSQITSLAWRVNETLTKAIGNIQSRSPQSFDDSDKSVFLNTSIPIWRLANIAAMGGTGKFVTAYSEIIAVDLAYHWFTEMTKTLQAALSAGATSQAQDVAKASEDMNQRIAALKLLAASEYQAKYQSALANMEMQRAVQWMHETMMRSMPSDFSRSMMTFNR